MTDTQYRVTRRFFNTLRNFATHRIVQRVRPVVSAVIAIVAIYFVVQAAAKDWESTSAAIKQANPWLLLGALASAFGAMAIVALVWGQIIVDLGGVRPKSRKLLSLYFAGEIGKYVPGAVWAVLGRGELLRREGASRSLSYRSVGISLAALYVTALVDVALIFLASINSYSLLIVVGLFSSGAVFTVAASFRPSIPRTKTIGALKVFYGYTTAWALVCLATALVATSLTSSFSISEMFQAVLLSWVFGLVIPTPGGLGAREAAFVMFSPLPSAESAVVALVARLLFIIVDAVGAAIGATQLRKPTSATGAN